MTALDRILAPIPLPPPRKLKKVHLACAHTVEFEIPPYHGDLIYCVRHGDYFEVIGGGQVKNRHYRCRDCGLALYTSKGKLSLETLRIRADTHSLKHGHVVDVFEG